jgi:hypothetical protein
LSVPVGCSADSNILPLLETCLVAEPSAGFLSADLDRTLEPREEHAAYIANWLDVLKADTARSSRQPATRSERRLHQRPAAGGLRRLPADRGIRGSRFRPIDILYVVAYFHAEYL